MARALAWFRRWGVSFASLGGGLMALLVFRRGVPHVAWIAGYLVLLWLLVTVIAQTRHALEASGRRSRRLIVSAAEYTIQTLYHGLLLFVLPAYWASATLPSVNAPFLGLLVALALIATFDPWYRALVQPHPSAGYLFFVVSNFASLNVALPLVGLPPLPSLVASAFVAPVALAPVVRGAQHGTWSGAVRTTVAIGIVAATLAALGRAWVPPVPLFMARAQLAWAAADIASLEPDPAAIQVDELRRRGLEARTAIYAPAGLGVPVAHVWRHAGETVSVVPLSPIHGGRREGYRTYSRKTAFPPDPVGAWTVDVRTASGQLIGRVRFRVVS